jgi:IS1 family transposase
MIYESPANQYYSDHFQMYFNLHYGASHYLAMWDKSETYSVEAGNAELRHYLTRLARKSRCHVCSTKQNICATIHLRNIQILTVPCAF